MNDIIIKQLTYFSLFILFFSSCTYQGTPEDKQEIEEVWKMYYSHSVRQQEKNQLLTSEFKAEYMAIMDSALNASESQLRSMDFEDKLKIQMKKIMIDSLSLSPIELRTFESAFNKLETTSSFLLSAEDGLDEIIFINEAMAYGVYSLLFNKKSNQFIKEKGQWKINPFKEHKRFTKARDALKSQYIQEYGSEDAAIDGLLNLILGRIGIWTPLSIEG